MRGISALAGYAPSRQSTLAIFGQLKLRDGGKRTTAKSWRTSNGNGTTFGNSHRACRRGRPSPRRTCSEFATSSSNGGARRLLRTPDNRKLLSGCGEPSEIPHSNGHTRGSKTRACPRAGRYSGFRGPVFGPAFAGRNRRAFVWFSFFRLELGVPNPIFLCVLPPSAPTSRACSSAHQPVSLTRRMATRA